MTSFFADDFMQLFQVYSNEDGHIVARSPGTLFKLDDFDFDELNLDDFYFSVPRLAHYN